MRRRMKSNTAFVRWMLAVSMAISFVVPALADENSNAHVESLFTNDFFGDGRDRWHTGSLSLSIVQSDSGQIALGRSEHGATEWRFRTEIISPSNTETPHPSDRYYVGLLSAGIHRHAYQNGWGVSYGLDFIATGPGTGMGRFQKWFHGLFGQDVSKSLSKQVKNAIYPTVTFEIGHSIALSDQITARPFMEMQAGAETLGRVGFDLDFGQHCEISPRDVTTGFRYAFGCNSSASTNHLTLGADLTKVFDSHLVAGPVDLQIEDYRARVRLGGLTRTNGADFFYGVTWLSEEFRGQLGSQVLGSISVNFRF